MRFSLPVAALLLALSIPAAASISVAIYQPSYGGYAGDVLYVQTVVSSTYQIQQVTATVADRSANLTYSSGYWTGTVSLAGLPRGSPQVQVVAQEELRDGCR